MIEVSVQEFRPRLHWPKRERVAVAGPGKMALCCAGTRMNGGEKDNYSGDTLSGVLVLYFALPWEIFFLSFFRVILSYRFRVWLFPELCNLTGFDVPAPSFFYVHVAHNLFLAILRLGCKACRCRDTGIMDPPVLCRPFHT